MDGVRAGGQQLVGPQCCILAEMNVAFAAERQHVAAFHRTVGCAISGDSSSGGQRVVALLLPPCPALPPSSAGDWQLSSSSMLSSHFHPSPPAGQRFGVMQEFQPAPTAAQQQQQEPGSGRGFGGDSRGGGEQGQAYAAYDEEEGEELPALPDDVNLEEQRMLMAAIQGGGYEGQIPGVGGRGVCSEMAPPGKRLAA